MTVYVILLIVTEGDVGFDIGVSTLGELGTSTDGGVDGVSMLGVSIEGEDGSTDYDIGLDVISSIDVELFIEGKIELISLLEGVLEKEHPLITLNKEINKIIFLCINQY